MAMPTTKGFASKVTDEDSSPEVESSDSANEQPKLSDEKKNAIKTNNFHFK